MLETLEPEDISSLELKASLDLLASLFLSLVALFGALPKVDSNLKCSLWSQTAKMPNPSFDIVSCANLTKKFSFCLSQGPGEKEMVHSKNLAEESLTKGIIFRGVGRLW